MLIIPVLMVVSFGLLISLVGLFSLSKTKKEGLGKMYKITSYLTILVGNLIVIGGIVIGSMLCCCHSSCGHGHGNMKCKSEMSNHRAKDEQSCTKNTHCKKPCESKCTKTTICTKDGHKEVTIEKEVVVKE